ncbi:stage II sporulation protein M [Dinghuibacter silviterrae]|uniref:Putative membrane protein SpoIIM required for sporulation n=1 Tax=Dinghuibacter silviterrae TaxID=1539049 RepID=A0A4R8DRS6_9BACT|nr:stage II sporulation protein M [Dinghuibacter silviterrae]TDX00924.1 putative membrane protein SpoIIM required for sporulation [Dinghuibacter silviterrae]
MREALFIKKNKDRWTQIEQQPASDPDEMATEFIQLVDDLSYAKTFYPTSRTARYLNIAASRMYLGIYKNRKAEVNPLARFCKYDLPQTIRRHHKVLLLAFGIFTLFFIVGVCSARGDESFIRGMLGNAYVNMTEDNIAQGKPFGVYANENALYMWLWILKNNIFVSIQMLAGGVLVGLLPIFQLVFEALRLGAFEALFAQKGLAGDFVLTVFIHGTLEISALIISGAAGIILGKGFLFPGTLSRLEAFKRSAKDACKIILGLVPVFITAAFFEGFVTRYEFMPVWGKLLILVGSLTFIIGYFIIYPIRLERKGGFAHA